MFYVYVIQSKKDDGLYTDSTYNLRKRFKEHNDNKVISTKGRGPFKLIYYEACINEQDAIAREKYLKSGMGKRYLKNRLKRFLSLTGFTLVELLITIIIVGVLVSLATPIYRQNIRRATATEGHALVGSIRTAERVYFAEHNEYTPNWADINGNVDISNNKYFTTEPTLTASGSGNGATFTATIIGSGDASGISISINHEGTITVSGI